MAKPYGDDLRRQLLQAYDRGEGTLGQLAGRFSVSVPWAWKISAQRKRSGQMERVEQRRGRKITPEVRQDLRRLQRESPKPTLARLQKMVAMRWRLHVSIGRLWQVLRQIGLRLKRSHSTPPKRISSNKPSCKRSAGSRRCT